MNAQAVLNFHLTAPPRLRTSAAHAILAALELKGHPMSARELAAAIRGNYHTARQIAQHLVSSGHLRAHKGKPSQLYSIK